MNGDKMVGRRVIKMMKAHRSMSEIIAAFGGKYTEADLRAKVQAVREYQRGMYKHHYVGVGGRRGIIPRQHKHVVPETTLELQDRRNRLAPKSITALICGDPLPGESALERRQQQQRLRDPLDDLLYAG